MGRTRIARAIIEELKKRISIAEKEKRELIEYFYKIHKKYLKQEISHSDYIEIVYKKRDGKNLYEWIDHFKAYTKECENRIKEQKKNIARNRLPIIFFSFIFILILLASAFYIRPTFVGFLIQGEIPEAISEANVTIITTQQQAILGQPVKWTKTISLDKPAITKIRLPEDATNITVNKISGLYSEEINKEETLLKQEDSSPSQEEGSLPSETKFRITGAVISETAQEGLLSRFFRNIGRLTGRAIYEPDEKLEIEINDTATEYEIEYETPAPYALEENIERGKRVKIIGPETIHYENVLSFTKLDEDLNIQNPRNVKIYWREQNTYINPKSIQDTNNNGIYDYIEWIAPVLSEQTFDIIVITKAEHLDSNRNFISDIYNEVRELDDVWSETISNQDYIRVTFEQKLDNTRDITLYPRVVSGNPKIEVYEINENNLIAEFDFLNSNEYNKVLLTNLVGEQDTFDLKVVGGSLEIDHIIDPASSYNISFVSPTPPNDTTTSNTSVTINVSITNADDLAEVKFNWNGTNYTLYNDSLVLMMNFDNVSALGENDTHVVDVSGNGNDGTITEAVLNVTGRYGGAYIFDGENDVISVPDSSSLLDLPLNNFSFSGWIKIDNNGNNGFVIVKRLGSDTVGWSISVDSFRRANLDVQFSTTDFSLLSSVNTMPVYSDGWFHLALTFNGDANASISQIYVDGTAISDYQVTTDGNGTYQTDGGRQLSMGRSAFSSYLNGSIDEVRIWNRSLSASEIQQLYFMNLNKYDTDKWLLYVNQSKNSTAGLDDGTYTYQAFAQDNVGNLNQTEERTITIDTGADDPPKWQENTTNSTAAGKLIIHSVRWTDDTALDGFIFSFDNGTGTFINDTFVSMTGTNNYSNVSKVVNSTVGSTIRWIVYANDSANQFNNTDTFSYTTTDTVAPNIEFVSPTPANATTTSNTSITINVSITNADDLAEVKFNWNGTNYTLYNDSLVLMMNFDNVSALGECTVRNQADCVKDLSGNGNNGTLGNATTGTDPTWNSTGKYGGAFEFDGVDDYVTISDSPSLSMSAATNDIVTASMWIFYRGCDFGLDVHCFIISKSSEYGFGIDETPLEWSLFSFGGNIDSASCSTPQTNVWTHYVGIYDEGADTGTIYINGELDCSGSLTDNSGDLSGPLIIGAFKDNDQYFNGTLDEVRLWNRSLTIDEVQQLYFMNLNKYDTDKWSLYVNQSKNSTDGLDDGTYTYQAFAQDDAGNLNQTEERTITIETTPPFIEFVSPTPPNDTTTSNTSVTINVSITNADDLAEVKFNWNGTNYTLYNDSLVLMMNFDNVSALGENDTFVVDVSGNGNDGTVIGGNVTTADGKYGRAMQFDGSDDYVNLSNIAILDGKSQGSISAWIKINEIVGNHNIFAKTESDNDGYGFWVDNLGFETGCVNCISFDININAENNRVESKSNTISLGNWHHVVGTFNGTDEFIYIDGILNSSITTGSSIWDSPSAYTGIGKSGGFLDTTPFNGSIDEIRVWSRSLTSSEVQQLYFTNLRKYDTDKWLLYVNQSKNSTEGLDDGTYTYQAFAQDNAGNLNQTEERIITIDITDTSPKWFDNSTNSTLAGEAVEHIVRWTDETNLAGYIFSFDNGTGSFVNDSFVSMTGTNNYSNVTKFVNQTVGSTIQWIVYANDSADQWNVTDTFTYDTTETTPPFIEFVSPTPPNDTTTSNTSIEINVSIIEADLDEVKFNWNGTNYTVYNDSLVLMMNFDNVSALGENDTLVVDVSGGGNNGTVNGDGDEINTTGAAKYGRGGLNLDGSGDYVNLGDYPDIAGSLSISTWVYPVDKPVSGWDGIVTKGGSGEGAGDDHNFLLALDAEIWGIGFHFTVENSAGSNCNAPTNDDEATGQWYHLVGVFDDSGDRLKLFVNGVIQANVSCTLTVNTNNVNTSIGWDLHSTGGYFDGLIDEVRIWNRSLSASEIQQLYFMNLNKYDTDKWLLYVNQSKNSTAGLDDGTYTYQAFAQDDAGNLNQTEERTVIILGVDTEAPKWQDNSTNSTEAGTLIQHIVNWTDDNALAGFIFSFDNGTGNFVNDTFVDMTGAVNWSNVTKNVNQTVGSTIQWIVYANDSSNNWNNTDTFTYDTTVADTTPPFINFTLPTPPNATSTSNTSIEINVSIIEANLDEVKFNWNGTNYTIFNDSLVLMMNFDNVSALGENDTHVVDISGYGNNGTVVNSGITSIINGKYARGFSFDAVNNNGRIEVSNSDIFDILTSTDSFAFFVWFNKTTDCNSIDNDNEVFATRFGTGDTEATWWFGCRENTDKLRLNFFPSGGDGYILSSPQIIDDGLWHHGGWVYNGSSTKLILYLDGVEADSTTVLSFGSGFDSSNPLCIGGYGNPCQDYEYNGLLDEIRIWNRSLSAAEVQQLYFMNLNKYDTDKWLLYMNQSKSSTAGLDVGNYTYQAFAQDDAGNLNQTEERTIEITTAADNPPKWQDNSTNSTEAGTLIQHIVNWTDNTALAGFIFSFDNGTGNFVNDTLVDMTGTVNWSNVSKVVNSTIGSTIRWRVYANDSVNQFNVTDIFIYNTTSANQAPTITNVEAIADTDPTEDSVVFITFNFTANDQDGASDINVSSAQGRFQLSGETTRLNTSCVNWSSQGNDVNFTCTIGMYYFDKNDPSWTINVTIKDNSDASSENSSTTFQYNQLIAIKISPNSFSFDVEIGAVNQTPDNDPTLINNTGNYDVTSGNVQVNAIDLAGEDVSTEFIFAANFSVDIDTGGSPPAECDGTSLVNGTYTGITNSILPPGNHSLNYQNETSGQEQLFYCIKEVPSDISSQTYSTSTLGSWTIRILLVAVIPAGRRKKKKKLIIGELSIPATIFSRELGSLEAISKYMKENLKMNYNEIAELLNRDQRTIWTSYKKATEKQKEPMEIEKTLVFLPTSIFKDRKLTTLESMVVYLKEQGLKYSEIAKLLDRDQRNIWTVYSKARKKSRT